MNLKPSTNPQNSNFNSYISYLIHIYTASGIVLYFLAILELFRPEVRVVYVFTLLLVAVIIDATDGPMARFFSVDEKLPHISGTTIDDIVDYIGFTLIPLLLVWRMGWLSLGGIEIYFIATTLMASLFGFANKNAKDPNGFFLGFPSYWNIYAFYAGIFHYYSGVFIPYLLLIAGTFLTIIPVRFLYPNRAPAHIRKYVVIFGILWGAHLVYVLSEYPDIGFINLLISLSYPAWYIYQSYKCSKEMN